MAAPASASVIASRAPIMSAGLRTPSQKRIDDKEAKRERLESLRRTPEQLRDEMKDLQEEILGLFTIQQRLVSKIPKKGRVSITAPRDPSGASPPYSVTFTRNQFRNTLRAVVAQVGKIPAIVKASMRRVRDTEEQKREGKGQYTPVYMGAVLRDLFNGTDNSLVRDEKNNLVLGPDGTPALGPSMPFLGFSGGTAGGAPLIDSLPMFKQGFANSQSIALAFIIATDTLKDRVLEYHPPVSAGPGVKAKRARNVVTVQFTPLMVQQFVGTTTRRAPPALYGAQMNPSTGRWAFNAEGLSSVEVQRRRDAQKPNAAMSVFAANNRIALLAFKALQAMNTWNNGDLLATGAGPLDGDTKLSGSAVVSRLNDPATRAGIQAEAALLEEIRNRWRDAAPQTKARGKSTTGGAAEARRVTRRRARLIGGRGGSGSSPRVATATARSS